MQKSEERKRMDAHGIIASSGKSNIISVILLSITYHVVRSEMKTSVALGDFINNFFLFSPTLTPVLSLSLNSCGVHARDCPYSLQSPSTYSAVNAAPLYWWWWWCCQLVPMGNRSRLMLQSHFDIALCWSRCAFFPFFVFPFHVRRLHFAIFPSLVLKTLRTGAPKSMYRTHCSMPWNKSFSFAFLNFDKWITARCASWRRRTRPRQQRSKLRITHKIECHLGRSQVASEWFLSFLLVRRCHNCYCSIHLLRAVCCAGATHIHTHRNDFIKSQNISSG